MPAEIGFLMKFLDTIFERCDFICLDVIDITSITRFYRLFNNVEQSFRQRFEQSLSLSSDVPSRASVCLVASTKA